MSFMGKTGQISFAPWQVSSIASVQDDHFICCTVSSPRLDKMQLYQVPDLQSFLTMGQATLWHLEFGNFFSGGWQVFNGPHRIDIA